MSCSASGLKKFSAVGASCTSNCRCLVCSAARNAVPVLEQRGHRRVKAKSHLFVVLQELRDTSWGLASFSRLLVLAARPRAPSGAAAYEKMRSSPLPPSLDAAA